jgi:FMN phosphatase YigB (HAD superfamily)
MREVWEQEYARLIRPTPGAAAMLAYWGQRKKIGVVSNFFLPNRPADYLRSFGLDADLAFVLDSAAFGWRKPHAAIFHEALRLAGLDASGAGRVLFAGDRPDLDILPARALGFQTLHFHRGKTRPVVEPTPTGIRAIYDWDEFR